jgi:CTP:molybdopterin cytidylyltransferase MocA
VKPATVVLAAGASERLGECKASVDLCGRSALERTLQAAIAGGATDICVVAGAHARVIQTELHRLHLEQRVALLEHSEWARGRSGSLGAAQRHYPGRDLLVAPIDVPLVPAAVFERLFAAWTAAGNPPRGWLAPFVEPGRRFGHPLVVGRTLAAGLDARPPDSPLKNCRAAADPVWGVEVFHPEILDDLDTPADLARLRDALRNPQE